MKIKQEVEPNPLVAAWDRLVLDNPHVPALFSPVGEAISREAVERRSAYWLEILNSSGIRAGNSVGLSLPNGYEWLAAFLAALRCRAVCLPLDPDLPEDRLHLILRQCRAAAVLRREGIAPIACSPKQFRSSKLAIGKVTSGSSGSPKVFYFTGAQLAADGRRIIAAMKIRPNDVNLGVIPWGHSYGLGNIIAPLLLQGTAATWSSSSLPRDIARTVSLSRATVFPSVPTLLRALLLNGIEPDQLVSLRLVISAGARLAPELAQELQRTYGFAVRNFYGSSETGGICYDQDGRCSLSGRSVGLPLPGVSIQSIQGGRLRITSDAVYTYGNRSAGSLGSVVAADHGYFNESGELVLKGRRRGFAKIGGKRISLAEVEQAIRALPEVSDACAFEIEIEGEASLAAAVESALPKRELGLLIRRSLSPNRRPKRILALARFPTTGRGKTDTAELRRRLHSLASS